jgi:hypothetical protein
MPSTTATAATGDTRTFRRLAGPSPWPLNPRVKTGHSMERTSRVRLGPGADLITAIWGCPLVTRFRYSRGMQHSCCRRSAWQEESSWPPPSGRAAASWPWLPRGTGGSNSPAASQWKGAGSRRRRPVRRPRQPWQSTAMSASRPWMPFRIAVQLPASPGRSRSRTAWSSSSTCGAPLM